MTQGEECAIPQKGKLTTLAMRPLSMPHDTTTPFFSSYTLSLLVSVAIRNASPITYSGLQHCASAVVLSSSIFSLGFPGIFGGFKFSSR